MRQLKYTIFITNNRASLCLRWKENLLKYQKFQNIKNRIVASIYLFLSNIIFPQAANPNCYTTYLFWTVLRYRKIMSGKQKLPEINPKKWLELGLWYWQLKVRVRTRVRVRGDICQERSFPRTQRNTFD